MAEHHVDIVAGDLNGACWRRHGRVSTIERSFARRCFFLRLIAAFGGPKEFPGEWLDCCGFIKPPGTIQECLIVKHGVFKHDRTALGLSAVDQTSHFQTLLHLVHAKARGRKERGTLQPRVAHERRDKATDFTTDLFMTKVALEVQDFPFPQIASLCLTISKKSGAKARALAPFASVPPSDRAFPFHMMASLCKLHIVAM